VKNIKRKGHNSSHMTEEDMSWTWNRWAKNDGFK